MIFYFWVMDEMFIKLERRMESSISVIGRWFGGGSSFNFGFRGEGFFRSFGDIEVGGVLVFRLDFGRVEDGLSGV